MTKVILRLLRKSGYKSGVILTFPITIERIIMAIPMLSICPISLMVPKVPEARPKYRLSTELMTAFVFGEEKKANPKPRIIKLITM